MEQDEDNMLDRIIEKKISLGHDMSTYYEEKIKEWPQNDFEFYSENTKTILLCKLIDSNIGDYEAFYCIDMVFKEYIKNVQFDEIFKITRHICKKNLADTLLSFIIETYEEISFSFIIRYPNESSNIICNDYFDFKKFLTKYEDHPNLINFVKRFNFHIDAEYLIEEIDSIKVIKAYCDSVRGIENFHDGWALADLFIKYPYLFDWHFKENNK